MTFNILSLCKRSAGLFRSKVMKVFCFFFFYASPIWWIQHRQRLMQQHLENKAISCKHYKGTYSFICYLTQKASAGFFEYTALQPLQDLNYYTQRKQGDSHIQKTIHSVFIKALLSAAWMSPGNCPADTFMSAAFQLFCLRTLWEIDLSLLQMNQWGNCRQQIQTPGHESTVYT